MGLWVVDGGDSGMVKKGEKHLLCVGVYFFFLCLVQLCLFFLMLMLSFLYFSFLVGGLLWFREREGDLTC